MFFHQSSVIALVGAFLVLPISSPVYAQTYVDSWNSGCVALIGNLSNWETTGGFVDAKGNVQAAFDSSTTWGITKAKCDQVCSGNALRARFNIDNFASAVSNWLLPWLALTAQLPFETQDWFTDFSSLFLAIGSPALITYSLAITILNRSRIQGRFRDMKIRSTALDHLPEAETLRKTMRDARYLLQEAQQVPLRLSQEDGWLSSLIILEENTGWWSGVRRSLEQSRRGSSYALLAQISMAALAFGLTVLSAFGGQLGDFTVALQLSSGSIWLWMLPVIMGWITVGTQSKKGTIRDALTETHPKPKRCLEDSYELTEFAGKGEMRQRGILAQSGLIPIEHRTLERQSSQNNVDQNGVGAHPAQDFEAARNLEKVKTLRWTRLKKCRSGDEPKEGPIFNHCRAFTWWKTAETLAFAFENALETLQKKKTLSGTGREMAHHCGLGSAEDDEDDDSSKKILVKAYYEWDDVPIDLWKHLSIAAVAALWIQWGTTGPALMIAYLTPTIGLGCRAGGFMVYGASATIAWFSLALSSILSHRVMLGYQRRHEQDKGMNFRHTKTPSSDKIWVWLANGTRYFGKALAFCNALWLLVRTLFEFSGVYANCTCASSVFGLGSHAYVVLYQDGKDTRNLALPAWMGGLFFSVGVCSIAFLFFWLGSRKKDNERD